MSEHCSPKTAAYGGRRNGVALIITLGVLSILLLVISAFTISMRTERLAARNARDAENSSMYLAAAETLAVDEISKLTIGRLYPCEPWEVKRFSSADPSGLSSDEDKSTNGIFIASRGYSVPKYSNLFTGPCTNLLPESYREAAESVECGWCSITVTNRYDPGNETPSGRAAFLIADLSGMLDIHSITTNQCLAASRTDDCGYFFSAVKEQSPYILPSELKGNRALYADNGESAGVDEDFLSALGVFSHDPNPYVLQCDSYFAGEYGSAKLTNKINLASITNFYNAADAGDNRGYDRYHEENLSKETATFFAEITNTLFLAYDDGTDTAANVFWNLINDFDRDPYPQTDTDHPWLDDHGIEAVPLISEFVFTNADETAETADFGQNKSDGCPLCAEMTKPGAYVFSAEVWYPFFTTNKIISSADAAVTLYKSTQTNGAAEAAEKIAVNTTNLAVTIETVWLTNKVTTSYSHNRNDPLEYPAVSSHTVMYGGYGDAGIESADWLYVAAGDVPAIQPSITAQTENSAAATTNFITLAVTNYIERIDLIPFTTENVSVSTNEAGIAAAVTNTVLSVKTNLVMRPFVYLTAYSADAPLGIYDGILRGPAGSIADGAISISYTNETFTSATNIYGFSFSNGTNALYKTAASFAKDNLITKDIREISEYAAISNTFVVSDGDAPIAIVTETEIPHAVTTASVNSFGEFTGAVTSFAADGTLRALLPEIEELLKSGYKKNRVSTDDETGVRYEITAVNHVKISGPETYAGINRQPDSIIEDISFTNTVEISGCPEFHYYTSGPFSFGYPCEHVIVTSNSTVISRHTVTNYFPPGICRAPVEIIYTSIGTADPAATPGTTGETSFSAETNFIEILNSVYFGARVTDTEDKSDDIRNHVFDEAPGPGSDEALDSVTNSQSEVWLWRRDDCFAMSVNDPRFNGRSGRWIDAPETPGEINDSSVFDPDADEDFQGLPLIHHNCVPLSSGDMGYICTGEKWRSINLLSPPGAMMPDLFTVRGPDYQTNSPARAISYPEKGRIHALTHHPAAVRAMFAETLFGTNRFSETAAEDVDNYAMKLAETTEVLTNLLLSSRTYKVMGLTDDANLWEACPYGSWISAIANASGTNDWRSSKLWTALINDLGYGKSAESETEDGSDAEISVSGESGNFHPGHDLLEDLFRDLPERVTFRQNIFMVILRAQTLSSASRVTSDSSEIIFLYRDSYTGKTSVFARIRQ